MSVFKRYFISLLFVILNIFYIFPGAAIELYNKGKLEYFNENYEDAVYYLNESLKINPNYLDSLLELANLYYDIGNYNYAYKYINRALKLIPGDNNLVIFSADIESELSLYESAENKYKKVLSEDPINIKAQNGLANLYLKTDNYILAKKTLNNILKTDPGNFYGLLLMARYYERNNNTESALKYYIENIEHNSLNPESYYYFSIYNYKIDNINEAITNIKTAISVKDRLKYRKLLAEFYMYQERGDESLKILKNVVKQEKHNYINFYNLAYSYFIISDYAEALQSLNKVINLRDSDEIAEFFISYLLINNYSTDNEERIKLSDNFYNKALRAKSESKYNLFIFYLKEAIRLYPKNIKARLDLAKHYLVLDFPERYIRELNVIKKYSDDKDILDRIEIEKRRISKKLGDAWNINQYNIEQDIFNIPIFVNQNILNHHFNSEKFFLYILKNIYIENMKFDLIIYDDKDYSIPEKIRITKRNESPVYLDLYLTEDENSITANVKLFNSGNNEIIKEYEETKIGNNKVLFSCLNLIDKINKDIMFKAHIIKISNNRAIINAGRRTGVNLKDTFVILKNKNYPIEFNRMLYIYDSSDIKGDAVTVKVDENISEIIFKDDDFFKKIQIDDIIIYKR